MKPKSLNRTIQCASLMLLVGIAFPTISLAQETPAALEEIVVTANKLGGATVLELPSAVKVISSTEISDRGAFDFVDIIGALPGLQFQDLGPGDKEYIIRGANSSGPSTVAVYFDETPITGSNAQDGGGRNTDIKLIDVQRIEVLNGPQGTQYGANAMSGLIRYTPVKPSADEFAGFVNIDFSDTSDGGTNSTLSGAINLPLIEDILAVRAVAWTVDNGGWIDQRRAAGGPRSNINAENTGGGRIMLRYTPNDALSLDLSYLKQDIDVDGSSRFTPPGTLSFGNSDSGFPAIFPSAEFENTDVTQSRTDESLDILSATLNYTFNAGTLTATYSNFERDIDFAFDSSPILFFFGVPIPGVTVQPQSREIDFAEVRFASSFDGSVQFLLGASMTDEESQFETQVVTIDAQGLPQPFQAGIANDRLSNPNGTTFFGRFVDNSIEQIAIFGEVSFALSDQLQLTIGGRYFDSDQESVEGTNHDFGSAAVTGPFFNKSSEDKVTGKIALAYQQSDSLNLYANISQGFRVGGLNNSQSLFVDDVPNSFESDLLTSLEVGFKAITANGNLNVALYTIDWEDIQLETVAGSAFPFTTNAGDARMNGLEIDFSTQLSEHFSLQIGGSLIDAALTTDQPEAAAGEDRGLDGDRIPNVPEVQGFASLTYATTVNLGELSVRTDISYRGSSDIRFDTNSANNFELDSSTIVNLRANLAMENNWDVAIYVKNLTDENALFDAISSTQDPLGLIAARPLTIGATLRKGF